MVGLLKSHINELEKMLKIIDGKMDGGRVDPAEFSLLVSSKIKLLAEVRDLEKELAKYETSKK